MVDDEVVVTELDVREDEVTLEVEAGVECITDAAEEMAEELVVTVALLVLFSRSFVSTASSLCLPEESLSTFLEGVEGMSFWGWSTTVGVTSATETLSLVCIASTLGLEPNATLGTSKSAGAVEVSFLVAGGKEVSFLAEGEAVVSFLAAGDMEVSFLATGGTVISFLAAGDMEVSFLAAGDTEVSLLAAGDAALSFLAAAGDTAISFLAAGDSAETTGATEEEFTFTDSTPLGLRLPLDKLGTSPGTCAVTGSKSSLEPSGWTLEGPLPPDTGTAEWT